MKDVIAGRIAPIGRVAPAERIAPTERAAPAERKAPIKKAAPAEKLDRLVSTYRAQMEANYGQQLIPRPALREA